MPDGKFTPIDSEPAYKSEFFQQLTGQPPPAVAVPPAEVEIPEWLKGTGQGGSRPEEKSNPKGQPQLPAKEEIPDWLVALGLDSTAPTSAAESAAKAAAAASSVAEAIPQKISLADAIKKLKAEKAASEAAAQAAAEEEPVVKIQVEETAVAEVPAPAEVPTEAAPAEETPTGAASVDPTPTEDLEKFKLAQIQKAQAMREEYVRYVAERSNIAPPVKSGVSSTETFAPDEPVIAPFALKRMERRGPDVIDPVRKIDASKAIIDRRYWGYTAETLVSHQRLDYLTHVAGTMAGSAGDIQAAEPLLGSIEGELRRAGYDRYKKSVLDLLEHDESLGLKPEETMLTLADERGEIRDREGRLVRAQLILGVAGLDEKGRTDAMELVHDLGGFIKTEIAKVDALYKTIDTGTFTLAGIRVENAAILEKAYQKLSDEVNQSVQAEELRLKRSIEDKENERIALKQKIENITNQYALLKDDEREMALKPRRPEIAGIDLEILNKDSEIENVRRDLESWIKQRDRVISNLIASKVDPIISVQEANMEEELRKTERDLLPMTQAEREAYANGRLETALDEGQTAMNELTKWGRLISDRSAVIGEAAALSVSYLTQIDPLIVSRNALMEKIEINSSKKDKAKASRDKKYQEELGEIDKQIRAWQNEQETAITEVIPSREKMSAEPRSTIGRMYQQAVLGGTVMIPNPDGKLEGVVKPGLYELAGYANLRIEIDDRARALREQKAQSKQPPVRTQLV